VLDEPTNDLDAETLELLEELVAQYTGTVLVISHDRAFLNNVVTSTIAFDPDGTVREYDGGYDDYIRQRPDFSNAPTTVQQPKPESSPVRIPKKKLSYKEQRELDELPQRIADLESQQVQFHEQMSDPEFFKQSADVITSVNSELEKLTGRLKTAYARWEELEEQANTA